MTDRRHELDRRQFIERSILAAAAGATPILTAGCAGAPAPKTVTPRRPTDTLRVAVIGVRGRGRGHVGAYKKDPRTEVVAICDADEGVIGPAMRAVPGARYVKDLRELLDDDDVDAVSIATPNHWHSLATIWALQAGKHVYVEKPISHNVAEGRAVVETARATGGIVQHGTQARSTAATREALAWLREGGLGECRLAHALCYKRRDSIGKVTGPQEPPATCDYDLWTGPAELRPLMRKNLHYDWHWDFNTGNGDMGNQGVHQMDIARWGLGLDGLPERVTSVGGRLGYDDDGNTPNTQVTLLDFGDRQIVFEVRGLPTRPFMGAAIGVVFHCEHGYLVSASYGKVQAFDHRGAVVREWKGGGDHFGNFVDAVLAGDAGVLNADAEQGHLSSALCHLGNVSYRLGKPRRLVAGDAPFGAHAAANESFGRFRDHLVANGLDPGATDYLQGPELRFDPATERFAGGGAAAANALLSRPPRGVFAVS